MTEAVRALLGYAFHDLDMHRIRATVVTANVASVRLVEGLSLPIEGLRRDAQFVNG
jgi:ribosomal-protein-alanine N-acetyltransferase